MKVNVEWLDRETERGREREGVKGSKAAQFD